MADPNVLRKIPTHNPRAATPRALAPSEPQMLSVKAVVDTLTATDGSTYQSPRVVYDDSDNPIPHDDFVVTPLTASLVLAIKAGDLVESEITPGLKGTGMPAEFGGRLTEEVQAARQERRDRAEEAKSKGQGGERQQPQDAAPTRQREGGRPDSSQDRAPERRQEDQQSRG